MSLLASNAGGKLRGVEYRSVKAEQTSLRLRNLEYVTGPIDVVGDEHYDLDGYLELDRQFDLAVEGLLVFLSQFPGYSRSPTASRACCRSRKTRMRRILLPSNS
jgi:hypothetical protein